MNRLNMIPALEFCTCHNIEIEFLNSLTKAGLIEIVKVEDAEYIYEDQLNDLEKIVRMHYDLDINLEGIETVIHLLERINEMEDEITHLKNRLRLYEGN
jgi:hypothetical protein